MQYFSKNRENIKSVDSLFLVENGLRARGSGVTDFRYTVEDKKNIKEIKMPKLFIDVICQNIYHMQIMKFLENLSKEQKQKRLHDSENGYFIVVHLNYLDRIKYETSSFPSFLESGTLDEIFFWLHRKQRIWEIYTTEEVNSQLACQWESFSSL